MNVLYFFMEVLGAKETIVIFRLCLLWFSPPPPPPPPAMGAQTAFFLLPTAASC